MDRIHPGPRGSRFIVTRDRGLTIRLEGEPESMRPEDMVWNHVPAPPTPEPVYPETILWSLVKDGKTSAAVIRALPHRRELRILMNGRLLWSELERPGVVIEHLADEKKRDFEARGWT